MRSEWNNSPARDPTHHPANDGDCSDWRDRSIVPFSGPDQLLKFVRKFKRCRLLDACGDAGTRHPRLAAPAHTHRRQLRRLSSIEKPREKLIGRHVPKAVARTAILPSLVGISREN